MGALLLDTQGTQPWPEPVLQTLAFAAVRLTLLCLPRSPAWVLGHLLRLQVWSQNSSALCGGKPPPSQQSLGVLRCPLDPKSLLLGSIAIAFIQF